MSKLKSNYKIISDKANDVPVTSTEYIKHGNKWLDEEIANIKNWITVNPNMTQAEIQTVIDSNSCVKFESGTYNVTVNQNYGCGFKIPSNRTIWMDNSIINLNPNDIAAYSVFELNGADNINIYGGTIKGDKPNHTGTGGEWGDCLSVTNCNHVILRDISLSEGWGDGIGIYASNHVNIENVKFINNRRNGLSIISGDNVRISNCYFASNGGTAPENAIDIETNNYNDVLGNIIIDDCVCENTVGGASVNISTHRSGKIIVHNTICDKRLTCGELGEDAKCNIIVTNCVFSGLEVGQISESSGFVCDNCIVEGSEERWLTAIGYDRTVYNIHINNLTAYGCDNTFLFTNGSGELINSDINIVVNNSSFKSIETTGFENSKIVIDNKDITAVLDYEVINGIKTNFVIQESARVNALLYRFLPVGTKIKITNATSTTKMMIDIPNNIKILKNYTGDGVSFFPNSVTEIEMLDSETIMVNSINSGNAPIEIVTRISAINGSVSEFIISETAQTNAISYQKLTVGSKVRIVNPTDSKHNIVNIPDDFKVLMSNEMSREAWFMPNSITDIELVAEKTLAFTFHQYTVKT